MTESITGEVTRRSKLYNEGWGFATVQGLSGREHKIVGTLSDIQEGMTVHAEGTWIVHEKYGHQLKIERIWEDDPCTEEGMVAWMVGRLPQIGPVRAGEIVKHFGAGKMFHVIEHETERLNDISGITPERVTEILQAFTTYKSEQKVFVTFFRMGFNKAEVSRIIKGFDEDLLSDVQSNPFELHGLLGFTFRRLDAIRKVMGLPDDFPPRLRVALIDQAWQLSRKRGDTCHDFEYFVQEAAEQLGQDTSTVMDYIGDAVHADKLAFFDRRVMLHALHAQEEGIANKIKELLHVGRERSNTAGTRTVPSVAEEADGERDDAVEASGDPTPAQESNAPTGGKRLPSTSGGSDNTGVAATHSTDASGTTRAPSSDDSHITKYDAE